jgi:hypothetical protein
MTLGNRCQSQYRDIRGTYQCEKTAGHAGKHYNAPNLVGWGSDEKRTDGTLTVKLVLDTTEFDAALLRVKEALRDLNETPVRVRVL